MMVRALHAAGIEVILDVVYNHTGEGNQLGPTLSMRGVDNASYYWLTPQDPRYHMDFSGCGNTLNMQHPRILQLIMDSLRYWVTEMRVDGFRFDLASTLARELFAVNRLGTFFDIIHQDPVLSQVKLIAEPWDVGEGGYQVGKEMSGNNLKVSGIINLPSLGSLRGKLLCPEQYIEGFASVPVGIVENRPRVPLLNSIEPSIGWSHPLTKKGDACSLPTWQANLVEEPSNT